MMTNELMIPWHDQIIKCLPNPNPAHRLNVQIFN